MDIWFIDYITRDYEKAKTEEELQTLRDDFIVDAYSVITQYYTLYSIKMAKAKGLAEEADKKAREGRYE